MTNDLHFVGLDSFSNHLLVDVRSTLSSFDLGLSLLDDSGSKEGKEVHLRTKRSFLPYHKVSEKSFSSRCGLVGDCRRASMHTRAWEFN